MQKPQEQSVPLAYKVMVTLALVLFCGNSFDISLQLLNAQAPSYEPPPVAPADRVIPQENPVCQQQMGQFLEVELGRFREFLRINFQNKSSTGSLLDTAFARYGELRTSVYNKYYSFRPYQGALQLTEGIESGACLQQVENTLALARHEIEARATQTSTVKQTTALISKYQEINSQLRTLTSTFQTMRAYLQTFSDKMPCYIRKGCNKG